MSKSGNNYRKQGPQQLCNNCAHCEKYFGCWYCSVVSEGTRQIVREGRVCDKWEERGEDK